MKSSISKHKTVVVLLHHPICGKTGEVISTSVTNLDIHDIARSCRTYEIDHYFIVTPLIEQKAMVERILGHWQSPTSQKRHPDRFEALSRVQIHSSFEAVKTDLKSRYSGLPIEVSMPDARALPNQREYGEARKQWDSESTSGVKVVVLGTGWGIASEFFPEVHTYLAPIYGPLGKNGYNHLSVRAAAAVILDRLFGHFPR